MIGILEGFVLGLWMIAGAYAVRGFRRRNFFRCYSAEDAAAIAFVVFLFWPIPAIAPHWPIVGRPITLLGQWISRP